MPLARAFSTALGSMSVATVPRQRPSFAECEGDCSGTGAHVGRHPGFGKAGDRPQRQLGALPPWHVDTRPDRDVEPGKGGPADQPRQRLAGKAPRHQGRQRRRVVPRGPQQFFGLFLGGDESRGRQGCGQTASASACPRRPSRRQEGRWGRPCVAGSGRDERLSESSMAPATRDPPWPSVADDVREPGRRDGWAGRAWGRRRSGWRRPTTKRCGRRQRQPGRRSGVAALWSSR